MSIAYVTYACDLPSGQVSAAFPATGEAYAALTANLERQEIGVYRASLERDQIARLMDLLRQSGYQQLPPRAPMLPDTPTLAIGEATAADDVPRLSCFLLRDLPSAIVPYVDAAREALKAVRSAPLRVLAGEAETLPAQIEVGQPVSLSVVLRNVGAEAFITDNPTRASMHDTLGLDLVVERLDPPPGLVEAEGLCVPLEPRHVTVRSGGTRDTSARLRLSPGEGVAFRILRRFRMSPGRYRAAVIYTTTNNTNHPTTLEGTLSMDAGMLTVVPRRRR